MSTEHRGPAQFAQIPANQTMITVFVEGHHELPYGTIITVVLPEHLRMGEDEIERGPCEPVQ